MGYMEGRLGNATPKTSWHQLHWWKSPRWIVIRIEALAVLAIIISFFLAVFGSCRRWSNRWIVQNGFFAAQVLSLSLGTYSIGLMQSSSVKSEMYPIWTVSLFALFGCIDPVIAYNGLDYKGPLSKMVYGICLQFGYVLLMSILTISGGVGNTAIIILSVITFIKCIHRSLALTEQSRMRNMVQGLPDEEEEAMTWYTVWRQQRHGETTMNSSEDKIGYFISRLGNQIARKVLILQQCTVIDFPTGTSWTRDDVHILDICDKSMENNNMVQSCFDVCISFGLSHKLQQHFLGLDRHRSMEESKTNSPIIDTDFDWALEVIEIELAFLYDVFFTGNPFLHYYQAKASSLWALASFFGICFVGVAAAIPGTITSRRVGSTKFVDTTTADLVVTFVILVSLAMLQLMHLIRCWTSNWARVAVACAYARVNKTQRNAARHGVQVMVNMFSFICCGGANLPRRRKERPASWWMRMKGFVATSTNWFDKYLWQDKIGQYSVLPEVISLTGKHEYVERKLKTMLLGIATFLYMECARLVKVLGLDYVWAVLRDLLGSDSKKRAAITLDDDVKASIVGFLDQIKTERIDDSDNWLCFPNDHPIIKWHLPYYKYKVESHGYRYTSCVMVWHIATWYCEQVEQEREKHAKEHRIYIGCRETAASYFKRGAAIALGCCFPSLKKNAALKENQNRRVANALSKYCTYLVVSAPELLPGPATETNRAYSAFTESVRACLFFQQDSEKLLGAMSDQELWRDLVSGAKKEIKWEEHNKLIREYKQKVNIISEVEDDPLPLFWDAVGLAKLLLGDDPPLLGTTRRSNDPWETLALVWVRLLVYAAPYGNPEAHMRHLTQGGEFIIHLWALLFHLDIREWKHPELEDTHHLQDIKSMDDAKMINMDDLTVLPTSDRNQYTLILGAIVFVPQILQGPYSDELATASKLEGGVRFYQTSNYYVARHFYIAPEVVGVPGLVLLNKEAKEKFTLYDGIFRAYDIAHFVTSNKLAFAKTGAQGTASSSVDNPIKKQSSEVGRQTEDEFGKESSGDEIEEEISPVS